ncbi:MAG: hypothetical protein JWO63_2102 [Frankiales bacterium]|jgi:hypothetical protein|nr:hypothetical protein [Frankiales bacterium]
MAFKRRLTTVLDRMPDYEVEIRLAAPLPVRSDPAKVGG